MAAPMKVINAFLIFRARDQSMRVVNRNPHLDWDEVAFNLTLKVPDPWGRLAGAVAIELPEVGPAVIEISPDIAPKEHQ